MKMAGMWTGLSTVSNDKNLKIYRIKVSKTYQMSRKITGKSSVLLGEVVIFLNELHAGFSLYEAKSVVNMHRQEINRILCPSIKI